MPTRGKKPPAAKRHKISVGNGTYSLLLDCAEMRRVDPDRLAEEVLGPALERLQAQITRKRQEAAHRAADEAARAKSLPTVLRRDFGLPE